MQCHLSYLPKKKIKILIKTSIGGDADPKPLNLKLIFLSVDTISLNENGRKRFRFDWLLILFPSSGCQTHIEDFKLHRLLLNSFLSISKAILDFLWDVIWWVVYLLPEFYLIISPDFFSLQTYFTSKIR